MVGLVDGHANVEGGEHGEHKGLDVGNQTLKHTDEDAEDNGNDGDTSTYTHGEGIADDEDNDNETEDDDMSGSHVGK